MRILGVLSLIGMALAGVGVGFRLLALGRRTRQEPERLLGAGLVLVAVVGGPIAGIGRLPGLVATPSGDTLFAFGLAATQLGIALFAAFTRRVFRADSAIATSAVLAIAAALGAEWLGLVMASGRGRTMADILPYTRPWGIAIVATLALVFCWTGVESLGYWSKLRRRVELQLADPVVANRLLLFAVAAIAVVALCTVIAGCMLAGLAPLRHAAPLAAIGLAAACASTCWTLAFLPPRAYLERVRSRAPASR